MMTGWAVFRTAQAELEQRWREDVEPCRPVFNDESWAKTDMTRLHGWTPAPCPSTVRSTAKRFRSTSHKNLTAFTPVERADCLLNAGYAFR